MIFQTPQNHAKKWIKKSNDGKYFVHQWHQLFRQFRPELL